MKVLYFDCLRYTEQTLRLLSANFELVVLKSPDRVTETKPDIDALFAPLGYQITERYLDFFPSLKCIISNTTGVAHIDLNLCRLRSIFVSALHDQQGFLETITSTAEHTIGLILAAHRRLVRAHLSVIQDGEWERRNHGAPQMLSRSSLGIVGFGRVGRRVGTIAKSIGMRVHYFDPYVAGGVESLSSLFKASDVIAVCAVSNSETRGLITREILEQLKPTSILVNTARGELIDLEALLDLLDRRQIFSAALDTIDGEYEENFTKSKLLRKAVDYSKKSGNLIITPHIAGSTLDAWRETESFVVNRAVRYLMSF